ncbi:MAG: hypothetical protein AAGA25_10140 [Planctomycetota bacterium]
MPKPSFHFEDYRKYEILFEGEFPKPLLSDFLLFPPRQCLVSTDSNFILFEQVAESHQEVWIKHHLPWPYSQSHATVEKEMPKAFKICLLPMNQNEAFTEAVALYPDKRVENEVERDDEVFAEIWSDSPEQLLKLRVDLKNRGCI